MQNENLVQPTVNLPDGLFNPSITSQPVKPLRVRYSKKQRATITEALDLLHGHKCQLCGSITGLEIDHKNGLSDQSLASLRWLCKSCNLSTRTLNDRAGLACVSVSNGTGDPEDSLEVNRRIEPAWTEFIGRQLEAAEFMRKDLLTGMSAYAIGCSVATVARYWKKHACPLGPFETYRPQEGTQVLVRLRKRPSE